VQSGNLECVLIAAEADCVLKKVHVLSDCCSVFLDYLKIVSVHSFNELLERRTKLDIKLTEQVSSSTNISDIFGKCLVQVLPVLAEVSVLSPVPPGKYWDSTIN
jgi:hypothetical protein